MQSDQYQAAHDESAAAQRDGNAQEMERALKKIAQLAFPEVGDRLTFCHDSMGERSAKDTEDTAPLTPRGD